MVSALASALGLAVGKEDEDVDVKEASAVRGSGAAATGSEGALLLFDIASGSGLPICALSVTFFFLPPGSSNGDSRLAQMGQTS